MCEHSIIFNDSCLDCRKSRRWNQNYLIPFFMTLIFVPAIAVLRWRRHEHFVLEMMFWAFVILYIGVLISHWIHTYIEAKKDKKLKG